MTRRLGRIVLLGYLVGLAALIAAILWFNAGHFSYSLDDAYIHLALADNLASGHHGLNPGEPASPSSSVLWPLILAPFAGFGWYSLVPLLIGTASIVGVWLVLLRFFRKRLANDLPPTAQLAIVLLMAFGLNFWGMPLNGMEHSLQLLLTAWVAAGLIDLVEDGRVRWTMLAGLALGPLVRYENASILLMGVAALWVRGWRARAVAVIGVPAAAIAAHATFLHSRGLPALPSSVLNKAEATSASTLGAMLYEIGENVLESLAKDRNLAVIALLLVLGWRLRRLPAARRARERLYGVFVAGVLGAHMMVGRYDWFGRYEIYLMLTAAIVLLFVFREALGGLLGRPRKWAVVGLVLLVLVAGKNQIRATFMTPVSAANIYAIHAQVHRFVCDYWHDNVAVTDVGWVSLGNPNYVLDVWGLASEEARLERRAASDSAWIERLAAAHEVDLLIVDAGWFDGPLPGSWERIAELGAYPIGYGRGPLTIFLRSPSRRGELRGALARFARTLPATSHLKMTAPAESRFTGPGTGSGRSPG